MSAEIKQFPVRRIGDHNVYYGFRYGKIGQIEIMVGRVIGPAPERFVVYLQAPDAETQLLATITGDDPERVGAFIDTIWGSVETALYFAREHSDRLLAVDPQPWGAA